MNNCIADDYLFCWEDLIAHQNNQLWMLLNIWVIVLIGPGRKVSTFTCFDKEYD